ncbi:MAG TPA: HlyD family efflux transporter periplasmic adaptor subunit [Nitrospiria bacterium]|nr:HlyD family efflux transporter periplasmic adaptor subunit [Nitrospiria bacterium]
MAAGIRRRLIPLLLVALLSLGAGFWFFHRNPKGSDSLTASGTVEATDAQLGFQSPGRIDAILVQEGDLVKAGRELAHLDLAETEARRQQAAARAEAARALLRELESGFRKEEVAKGRAALAAAKQRLNDARRDLERTKKLYENDVMSRQAYDKALVAFDVAQSEYKQALEQMRILEKGQRTEKIEAQRAEVAQAEAAVRVIDAMLANMTIRAPFDGVVTVRHREPGEIVPAGSPVLTVMNRDDRWVRIYVPEDRIAAVHIGTPAAITTDTDPNKMYQGKVFFIASEAEFTPKSVQTTEERVRLVFETKVRVLDDPTYDLKPGMPADVRLNIKPQ